MLPKKLALLLVLAVPFGAVEATPETISKDAFPPPTRAVVVAGNGIYRVHVDNGPGGNCGTWTATTGPNHPAGPGLNVLFGGGTPGTSNTILRSYTSGTDYATGGSCTSLCGTVAPTVTPILNGATIVGYRLLWTFVDGGGGPTIQLEQEVVVVGPVDGSETVDNTVVRETHTVRNAGPGSLSFGLRKQWDWQIGGNDGPFFGSCAAPSQACDVSMNLTPDGSLNGMYPGTYVINSDPAITACPAGVTPIGPNCGGMPPYLVAGTVAPPSGLSPVPSAPELLQFNSWPNLISSCWEPVLANNAFCGGGGDTAVAYFYGRTAGTAIVLAAGQERSFTEYVAAAEGGCPAIVGTVSIPALDFRGIAVLALVLLATVLFWLRRGFGSG